MRQRLSENDKRILIEAARIKRRLNEYTGGDGWQTVFVDDHSWEHLEVGVGYLVRGMPGVQIFKGWVDSQGNPTDSEDAEEVYLLFEDEDDGDVWEVYEFKGKFVWGSGAKPLVVKAA
jgi:hypothetical protein